MAVSGWLQLNLTWIYVVSFAKAAHTDEAERNSQEEKLEQKSLLLKRCQVMAASISIPDTPCSDLSQSYFEDVVVSVEGMLLSESYKRQERQR